MRSAKADVVRKKGGAEDVVVTVDRVGAQVGYTFQPGSRLNGLGILLQVSNVLNSPYRTYLGTGPNNVPMLDE